jgi:hypothetical protein
VTYVSIVLIEGKLNASFWLASIHKGSIYGLAIVIVAPPTVFDSHTCPGSLSFSVIFWESIFSLYQSTDHLIAVVCVFTVYLIVLMKFPSLNFDFFLLLFLPQKERKRYPTLRKAV